MPDLKLAATVTVTNAAPISINRTLTVEGVDTVQVSIASGGSKEVDLLPDVKGKVQLLVITADAYSADIVYKINADAKWHPLDQPLMLAGLGAISMFTDPPSKLTFENRTAAAPAAKDAVISILAGRSV